jgi:CXXC-20-CXXC protein
MNTLGICPHCREPISARHLLRMSRIAPYRCRNCGGESVIAARSGMWAVVSYVAAISIPLLTLTYFDVPRVALYAVATVAALVIPSVFALICRFDPVRPAQRGR